MLPAYTAGKVIFMLMLIVQRGFCAFKFNLCFQLMYLYTRRSFLSACGDSCIASFSMY